MFTLRAAILKRATFICLTHMLQTPKQTKEHSTEPRVLPKVSEIDAVSVIQLPPVNWKAGKTVKNL